MQQKGVITIQKPYLGWIPTFTGTTLTHGLESTTGITSQSLINYPSPDIQDYSFGASLMLTRPGFEGHISPGPSFTNVTDNGGGSPTVNGLPINAVTAPDGNCYVMLDSNRYVILNLATQTISVNNYHDIGSTAGIHSGHSGFTTVYDDVCIYPTNGTSSNYYTYATWDDSTDGDIAQISGNSVIASNYYTETLGGGALRQGVPHPLLSATSINQNIYFGNGSYLGMFNPITPAHADQALALPPGWIINGLTTYQDYIAIAAYKLNNFSENPLQASQSKLYLWNGTDAVPSFQYDIQDNFVSSIYFDGKDLYVITYGRNNTTKLKKFNGVSFDILWESNIAGGFPGGTTSPNPCFGAMDMWLNHVIWSNNANGEINTYGSPSPKYPDGFHSIASVSATNGMCKNLYGNQLFIGNKSGSTYTIKYSNLNGFDTSATFISPLFPLPTNSVITYVKLYPSYWPSSSSNIYGSIVKDYNASGFGTSNDLLNYTFTGATNSYYLQRSQTIDNVNSFYFGLNWGGNSSATCPIIRKAEVGFTYDDDNI